MDKNRVLHSDHLPGVMVEMMHKLFNDADEKMIERLEKPEDFYLSIPDFLIQHITTAVNRHYQITDGFTNLRAFLGVTIIGSHDLAITLFHKDYPLYNFDWMIRKIPLSNPRKVQRLQGQWYTEYVIKLHEGMSYFKNQDNSELN